MATLNRDGTTLFYEETGAGDPPIVFVHGWTCDHAEFAPQVAYFAKTHRVISVDLRGHGASDAPEGPYAIKTFADDVTWLCQQLHVEQPVVVGHSMGGAIALELAGTPLPRAVVMVDAAPIVIAPELRELLTGLVAGLTGPDHETMRRSFIEGMLFIPEDDPKIKAKVVEKMMATPKHVAIAAMENLGTWDGEAALKACAVPALHIGAANSINDPTALRNGNPLVQTGQTVGAGHFNQLLVPEQVNPMIERFLSHT
jgi:pimeloyl-ACP methyl ester carboxylesterase